MNDISCPKCGRDIYDEYEDYLNGNYNKYIKIKNYRTFFDGEYLGHDWDVKCICPKCKEEFWFSDSDV